MSRPSAISSVSIWIWPPNPMRLARSRMTVLSRQFFCFSCTSRINSQSLNALWCSALCRISLWRTEKLVTGKECGTSECKRRCFARAQQPTNLRMFGGLRYEERTCRQLVDNSFRRCTFARDDNDTTDLSTYRPTFGRCLFDGHCGLDRLVLDSANRCSQ